MADSAIIFDVDGVLLELTSDVEDIFFRALSKFVSIENLSRDWNSYKIRNDENIIAEILERNDLPATLQSEVTAHYLKLLQDSPVQAVAVEGALQLLTRCAIIAPLGIATANLRAAAQHRLQQVKLWPYVADNAVGADGGGHKSVILGRALQDFSCPPKRVVYVGDNRNDVEAGLQHGVHFIGFSTDAIRREQLKQYGALHISANHMETMTLIGQMLA